MIAKKFSHLIFLPEIHLNRLLQRKCLFQSDYNTLRNLQHRTAAEQNCPRAWKSLPNNEGIEKSVQTRN